MTNPVKYIIFFFIVIAVLVTVYAGLASIHSMNDAQRDFLESYEKVQVQRNLDREAFPLGCQVTVGDSSIPGTIVRYESSHFVVLILGSGAVAVDPKVLKRITAPLSGTTPKNPRD